MGVGGSFDVLAGFIKRAPRGVQALGLEWLWRLLIEPRKLWKRYLTTNSEFVWLAGREIVARRLGCKS
jgi:N-acetylglucosaminyldiphosphoundecaprenol N-acetyl-beta-D-mannosaminyltransferase